jgi:hypothetical protein
MRREGRPARAWPPGHRVLRRRRAAPRASSQTSRPARGWRSASRPAAGPDGAWAAAAAIRTSRWELRALRSCAQSTSLDRRLCGKRPTAGERVLDSRPARKRRDRGPPPSCPGSGDDGSEQRRAQAGRNEAPVGRPSLVIRSQPRTERATAPSNPPARPGQDAAARPGGYGQLALSGRPPIPAHRTAALPARSALLVAVHRLAWVRPVEVPVAGGRAQPLGGRRGVARCDREQAHGPVDEESARPPGLLGSGCLVVPGWRGVP